MGWPNCLTHGSVLQEPARTRPRRCQRQSGDADAAGVERLHEVGESLPSSPEQILDRDFDVFEDQLAGVGGTPAQLVFLFPRSKAGAWGERLVVADADGCGRCPDRSFPWLG